MKQQSLYLSIILYMLLLQACKKHQLDDCFSSMGPETTELRQLEPFSKLKLNENYTVILRQDTTGAPSVRITAGKNLLEGIVPVVKHGVLEFRNDNVCNFVRSFKRKIRLDITLQALDEIIVTAAPELSTPDTLQLLNLNIWHSALSDIDLLLNVKERVYVQAINSSRTVLRGKARKLEGSIEEVADLDARELLCEEVLIDSHTPLNCYVNASQIVFVKIYNQGNIYYVTEPLRQKEVNVRKGSGNLIKLTP